MKILLYESISAAFGNITANKCDQLPSLLQMGLSMRNAVESDLKKIENISLVIGKHNPEDNMNSYLERTKPDFDSAWVIAPETKNELIEAKEILSGKHWIGCEKNALLLTTNKSLTKKKLLEFNILNPDSNHFKNLSSCEYVVKPEDGAGCESTTKYISLDSALKAQKQLEALGEKTIIERFIHGKSMSFSMLCSPKATEVISINHQLIQIQKNGEFSYSGINRVNHQIDKNLKFKIYKVAGQIIEAFPGLKGFVGVDFILDQKSNIYVIEINPRVTCAYIGLSNHLNRSLAKEILEICL